VHVLLTDASVPATVYAGTVGGGVFKSSDPAQGWQPTGGSYGNGAAPPTAISKVSGDNQTARAGLPLQYPLVTVVTNANGVPVAGVMVEFAVTSGGGTLSNTEAITDSQGVAFTQLTLGSNGGISTIAATGTGLSGSPLVFAASAVKTRRGQLLSQ
jgi:hypothetical protein